MVAGFDVAVRSDRQRLGVVSHCRGGQVIGAEAGRKGAGIIFRLSATQINSLLIGP